MAQPIPINLQVKKKAQKSRNVVMQTPQKPTQKVLARPATPFPRFNEKELEEMRKKFYEEPTYQDLGDIFIDGLANGMLVVDEDEEAYDYPEEPDSTFALNFLGESQNSRCFQILTFSQVVLLLPPRRSSTTHPQVSTRSTMTR